MNQTLQLAHVPAENQHAQARIVRYTKHTLRLPPVSLSPRRHGKVEVGCLAHAPHEVMGPAEIANAKRRIDFYSRWHGLKEPLLQIWKASS